MKKLIISAAILVSLITIPVINFAGDNGPINGNGASGGNIPNGPINGNGGIGSSRHAHYGVLK